VPDVAEMAGSEVLNKAPVVLLRLSLSWSFTTVGLYIRIEQFITQRSYEQYFCFRVPAIWNKINVNTINCLSAKTFKKHLSSSLFLSQ
jgi:hypothetical protein